MGILLAAAVFAIGGIVVGMILGRAQAQRLANDELSDALQQAAVLETQLAHVQQQLSLQGDQDQRLMAEFDRLSRRTLQETSEGLVKAAEQSFKLAQATAKGDMDQQRTSVEHLVKPVQDNLARLEQFISNTEQSRKEEYGGLFQQMREVAETTNKVQAEAAALKNVLRSSSATRGRWGEVQLRRVVELAGMNEHADFSEQTSISTDDGRFRADLIVYLPGDVKIAVDAKVPYGAYEQAQTADDPLAQEQLFLEHAKQFRHHVDALAKRKYWEHYTPSSGFTVLFVPGEALLDTALMYDAGLWESAAERHILLATPSTLIALLRMASLGWRQEAQAENAVEITKAGRELYKRLVKFSDHIERLGRNLNSAVGSYNDFVGSLESRVLPQARRLSDMGAGDGVLPKLTEVDDTPRRTRTHQLLELDFEEAEVETELKVVPRSAQG